MSIAKKRVKDPAISAQTKSTLVKIVELNADMNNISVGVMSVNGNENTLPEIIYLNLKNDKITGDLAKHLMPGSRILVETEGNFGFDDSRPLRLYYSQNEEKNPLYKF